MAARSVNEVLLVRKALLLDGVEGERSVTKLLPVKEKMRLLKRVRALIRLLTDDLMIAPSSLQAFHRRHALGANDANEPLRLPLIYRYQNVCGLVVRSFLGHA